MLSGSFVGKPIPLCHSEGTLFIKGSRIFRINSVSNCQNASAALSSELGLMDFWISRILFFFTLFSQPIWNLIDKKKRFACIWN